MAANVVANAAPNSRRKWSQLATHLVWLSPQWRTAQVVSSALGTRRRARRRQHPDGGCLATSADVQTGMLQHRVNALADRLLRHRPPPNRAQGFDGNSCSTRQIGPAPLQRVPGPVKRRAGHWSAVHICPFAWKLIPRQF
jgi:hypothetical protein